MMDFFAMMTLEQFGQIKLISSAGLLAVFWIWETWHPFFGWQSSGRVRHGLANLAIAVMNTLILGLIFGTATVGVAEWANHHQLGLLNWVPLPGSVQFGMALVLSDAWLYAWHRANHTIPLLWRFHRMHHSDTKMDVTTATRFHLGELSFAAVLRLGVIIALGLRIEHTLTYDLLVLASTQFHHADISLGRLDRWLRGVFVTPDMHKVHHSREFAETNSNYSTILSLWDRLAVSFRMRTEPKTIEFGLEDFREPDWQTIPGLWKTPFVKRPVPPSDRIK
ncbi:MAG: sterol desaturase family protein [Planctomycetaceae bacterium]|nr:sterol desaturase family protein [Planctomycetaceae bacterium]